MLKFNKLIVGFFALAIGYSAAIAGSWTSGTINSFNLQSTVTSYWYYTPSSPSNPVGTKTGQNTSIGQIQLTGSSQIYYFLYDGSDYSLRLYELIKDAKMNNKTINIYYDSNQRLSYSQTDASGGYMNGNTNPWVIDFGM